MKKLLIGFLLITPTAYSMDKVKQVKEEASSSEATEMLLDLFTEKSSLRTCDWKLADEAKKLIEQGADCNAVNKNGETLLHWAARIGLVMVCRMLVDKKAAVDVKDSSGSTPSACAMFKHSRACDYERKFGISAERVSPKTYETILDILNTNSDESNKLLQQLREKRPDKDEILRLIKQGADVNACNLIGNPCLMAVKYEPEVVTLLLDAGADLHARGSELNTALHWAAIRGSVEICRVLLQRKAEVNAKNVFLMTPLHKALESGNRGSDLYTILLDYGADLNSKNKFNETPFRIAVKNEQREVCREELRKRTELNVKDEYGNTPLCYAAKLGLQDLCFAYVEKGADTSVTDEDGNSVFFLAAGSGLASFCTTLLENDNTIDVNAKDKYGRTALHVAASRGRHYPVKFARKLPPLSDDHSYALVAKLLIDYWADVQAQDEDGRTPYNYYVIDKERSGKFKLVQFEMEQILLDAQANK